MGKVLINRWDGGIAMSERAQTINEQLDSGGYDVFYDSYKAKKLAVPSTLEVASGASVTSGECVVYDATKRATDGRIIGVGQTASGTYAFRFYRKDTSISGNWTQNSASAGSVSNANAYAVLYKDVQYGYFSNSSGSNALLYRYDSDSAHTLIDTVSDYNSSICPAPVIHSQDDRLYYASGKTIRYLDNTTPGAGITMAYNITSMCEYGPYLAIACQTPTGGVIYLWGRNTSSNSVQEVIKVDDGKLMIIENLNGYLISVSEKPFDPYVSAISVIYSSYGFNIRMYVGGTMKLIKQVQSNGANENGSSQILSHKKTIKDGTLIFSTNSNFLWRFGINKEGQFILSRDQMAVYTGRTLVTQYSFFILGEYFFSAIRTSTGSPSDGLLVRTDANTSYTDTTYFVTTINPSMPPSDRVMKKRLKTVAIRVYNGSTSNGSITVKYSFDGASYSTAISRSSTFTGNFQRFEEIQQSDGDQFKSGTEIKFKIESTYQIDLLELYYEYEIEDTLLKE